MHAETHTRHGYAVPSAARPRSKRLRVLNARTDGSVSVKDQDGCSTRRPYLHCGYPTLPLRWWKCCSRDVSCLRKSTSSQSNMECDGTLGRAVSVAKERHHVGARRLRCVEVLFHSTMLRCVCVRKYLYLHQRRVVSGTNMFSKVFGRMTKELTASAPSAMKIRWLLHQTTSSSLASSNASTAEMLLLPKINVINDNADLLLMEVAVAETTASLCQVQCVAGWR